MSHRESTVRGWELGTRLRELRERAKVSGYEAAARIGTSVSTVSRIDTGKRAPTPEETASLLTVYGVVGAERAELIGLAHEAAERDWWQRYHSGRASRTSLLASLESRASTITTFELNWIPGLLQTSVYTAALMRGSGIVPEEEIEHRVGSRLARHNVLFRRKPVHLLAIIDESALHRRIGSPAVMHRQLEYLSLAGERANISIRVIPANVGVPAANWPFMLLRLPVAPRTVVFLEQLDSSMFFEKPESTHAYELVAQRLLDVALSAGESAGLITRLMRTLEADPDVLPHIPCPEVAEE